jgi:hypothetical protein
MITTKPGSYTPCYMFALTLYNNLQITGLTTCHSVILKKIGVMSHVETPLAKIKCLWGWNCPTRTLDPHVSLSYCFY